MVISSTTAGKETDPSRNLKDVGDPQTVSCRGGEVAVEQPLRPAAFIKRATACARRAWAADGNNRIDSRTKLTEIVRSVD